MKRHYKELSTALQNMKYISDLGLLPILNMIYESGENGYIISYKSLIE